MIPGLVQILVFQGLGELASHFLLPSIPGPVIGLLLLLGFLALRKSVPKNMDLVASATCWMNTGPAPPSRATREMLETIRNTGSSGYPALMRAC